MNIKFVVMGVIALVSAWPSYALTITNINQLAKKQVRLTVPQSAQLVGSYADTILRETHAQGPIMITTELVHPIDDQCGRIQATTTIKNTPRLDGQVGDFWTKVQFDICSDGNPPSERK